MASFFAALGCSRIMAHLRRSSSLFFIPLVPYPARFARHLPHAGKALSVVILFPHMHVFALTMRENRYPRIVAFPIGEGGPRQRRSGALVNCRFETISLALFHPARTLSGSLRSPPSPHGEGFVRRYSFSTYACIRFDDARKAVSSYRSLPHWGRLCWGKRYSRFFIHPTQKRPSLTSGRFYVYYLLRETLIKSQNSISHVFSCNASSYSSLNSSLFASKYSLHCMKI